MKSYVRPIEIANDMGGSHGKLDERMRDIMELLSYAPDGFKTILDVGIGKGQISKYFMKKGKHVTGIGLELESYAGGQSLLGCRKED